MSAKRFAVDSFLCVLLSCALLTKARADDETGSSPEARCPIGKQCDETLPQPIPMQSTCNRTKCQVIMNADGSYTCQACCPPGDLVLAGDYLNSSGQLQCQCPKAGQVAVVSGAKTVCKTRVSCPYYAFHVVEQSQTNHVISASYTQTGSLYTYSGPPLDPSFSACLRQQLAIANSKCSSSLFLDDCIASYFGAVDGQFGSQYHFNIVTQADGLMATGGVVYLNSSCQQVQGSPPAASACNAGSFGWIISPVSLLWTNDEDVDSQITLTAFAVDPNKPGQYFLWKGSSKAPLLVYDPEHKGQIKDGTQLFGNWTFGGKRTASLGMAVAPSLWRDGFEALATLDADGDGKIANAELEPLALWFDKNQNGIAEPGEVIPVADLGVTAIYFKPDRRDPITKSLIVSRGFERTERGIVRTGSAVDWYSDGAPTKEELIAKHLSHASLCGAVEANGDLAKLGSMDDPKLDRSPSKSKAEQSEALAASRRKRPSITGLWRWTADQDQNLPDANQLPQGYFTIADDGKGGIAGHSYVQMSFPDTIADPKSMLTVFAFKGERKAVHNQELIHFAGEIPYSTRMTSDAHILDGGKIMEGSSAATVKYEGKPITITYKWTAEKE
jgi:hypothetical protein